MPRGVWLVLVLGCFGCEGTTADHERLGDAAYLEGRFGAASAEFQMAAEARPAATVWAKLGAAALAADQFRVATQAFQQLAATDPDRAGDAAIGIDRIVRAALRERPPDINSARDAILALRRIAPDRPVGIPALTVARSGALGVVESVALLPAALGAAGSARLVDSLLLAWGNALRESTACDAATQAFSVALRRSRNADQRGVARDGITSCGLRLGMDALDANQPDVAETWFRAVLKVDSLGSAARRAGVGVGDARLRQGDVVGALLAWQRVLDLRRNGEDGLDSVTTMTLERMAALRPETETPRPEDGSGT